VGRPVLAASARTAIGERSSRRSCRPAHRAWRRRASTRRAFTSTGRAMRQLESDARGDRLAARAAPRLPRLGRKGSERDVWPLAHLLLGRTRRSVAWCRAANRLPHFRVDRIAGLETLERRYPDEAASGSADFIVRWRAVMRTGTRRVRVVFSSRVPRRSPGSPSPSESCLRESCGQRTGDRSS